MQEILDWLLDAYLFDLWLFSQWWMYAFIIPILLYVPAFVLKWVLLTTPVWAPFMMIFSAFYNRGCTCSDRTKRNNDDEEDE